MEILNVKATVVIPRVPNFILTAGEMKLPLSAFDDAGLLEIAKQWTANLLERAAEQRKNAGVGA